MEQPKIAISQLGFPDTTFAEDIAIATEVGIQGISPDERKVGSDGAQLAAALSAAGLDAAVGTPSVLTILPNTEPGMDPGPQDPADRIASIISAIDAVAALKPETFLVITGPQGDRSESEAHAIVVDGLRSILDAATRNGFGVGLEPMREAFRPRWTTICSLSETMNLIEEVGHDGLGIVFDTWHMWDSANVYEDLPHAAARLHGIQIADYRDPTRSAMDRVAAGDGIARIDRLIAAAREHGFEGFYDLEIFSDDGRFGFEHPDSLWKLDPLEYARRQVAGLMSCWA